MSERMTRLQEALRIAERVGNTFLAANLRAAIQEETRLTPNTTTHSAHPSSPDRLP